MVCVEVATVRALQLLESECQGAGAARGRQTHATPAQVRLLRSHVALPELAAQTLAQVTPAPALRLHQHGNRNRRRRREVPEPRR